MITNFITLTEMNLANTGGSFSLSNEIYQEYYSDDALEQDYQDSLKDYKEDFYSQVAFKTNINTCLVYDYAKSKVRRTYTLATENFFKACKRPTKEQHPRIDLFKSSQKGIWLDFDSLEALKPLMPEHYSASWSNARRWIENRFRNNGFTITSISGKAKVFIPLQISEINQISARNIAKRICGDSWFSALDYNGGFRYSFIDANSWYSLSGYLKSIDFTSHIENNKAYVRSHIDNVKSLSIQHHNTENIDRESEDIVPTSSTTYKWKSYEGNIPQNMLDNLNTKNKHIEGVIRYALGHSSCISNGVAIPGILLGQTLNIRQQVASRAIKKCLDLGILKKVSTHIVGYKACRYVFCGLWLSWATQVVKELPRPVSRNTEAILKEFRDGNWNNTLWKLTNYFSSENDYLLFVKNIPGINDKNDRYNQAIHAWNCHIKADINKNKINMSKLA